MENALACQCSGCVEFFKALARFHAAMLEAGEASRALVEGSVPSTMTAIPELGRAADMAAGHAAKILAERAAAIREIVDLKALTPRKEEGRNPNDE